MNKSRIITIVLGMLLLLSLCACSPRFPTGAFETAAGTMLEFKEDGTYKLTSAFGKLSHQGIYSVEGDLLTLMTDTNCDQYNLGKGVYNWTYEDDKLVFHLVEDNCKSRTPLFDAKVPYYKYPYVPKR
ncbi:MAG: hypothetical protein AB1894_23920 [Chloroflexota bacterium]